MSTRKVSKKVTRQLQSIEEEEFFSIEHKKEHEELSIFDVLEITIDFNIKEKKIIIKKENLNKLTKYRNCCLKPVEIIDEIDLLLTTTIKDTTEDSTKLEEMYPKEKRIKIIKNFLNEELKYTRCINFSLCLEELLRSYKMLYKNSIIKYSKTQYNNIVSRLNKYLGLKETKTKCVSIFSLLLFKNETDIIKPYQIESIIDGYFVHNKRDFEINSKENFAFITFTTKNNSNKTETTIINPTNNNTNIIQPNKIIEDENSNKYNNPGTVLSKKDFNLELEYLYKDLNLRCPPEIIESDPFYTKEYILNTFCNYEQNIYNMDIIYKLYDFAQNIVNDCELLKQNKKITNIGGNYQQLVEDAVSGDKFLNYYDIMNIKDKLTIYISKYSKINFVSHKFYDPFSTTVANNKTNEILPLKERFRYNWYKTIDNMYIKPEYMYYIIKNNEKVLKLSPEKEFKEHQIRNYLSMPIDSYITNFTNSLVTFDGINHYRKTCAKYEYKYVKNKEGKDEIMNFIKNDFLKLIRDTFQCDQDYYYYLGFLAKKIQTQNVCRRSIICEGEADCLKTFLPDLLVDYIDIQKANCSKLTKELSGDNFAHLICLIEELPAVIKDRTNFISVLKDKTETETIDIETKGRDNRTILNKSDFLINTNHSLFTCLNKRDLNPLLKRFYIIERVSITDRLKNSKNPLYKETDRIMKTIKNPVYKYVLVKYLRNSPIIPIEKENYTEGEEKYYRLIEYFDTLTNTATNGSKADYYRELINYGVEEKKIISRDGTVTTEFTTNDGKVFKTYKDYLKSGKKDNFIDE